MVLIVDDDSLLRRLVRSGLEQSSVQVREAPTVAAATDELRHFVFDVVILDLSLPDGSGFEVLTQLAETSPATHVILLTGATKELERVHGLERGADDYVVKPFFTRELIARVLAVQRRRDAIHVRAIRVGGLEIDLAGHRVLLDGSIVDLTAMEFALLAFLAGRPGRVFSRDELLREVWRSAAGWQSAGTVTEHIRRLRSKIERGSPQHRLLRTVRGAGYRFDLPALAEPTDDGDEFRRGLDNHEFHVYYQPVVSLEDHSMIAVEALVRWQHPTRGLLLPAAFIDSAERSGMILELGAFVLDTASRQTAEWRRDGVDINLAVNISATELGDPHLGDRVAAIITNAGLDFEFLWLEVTETVLITDFDQASATLHSLADRGVGISIDDFGTGWASLTYLKSFPIHVLKIDQSFVADIDQSADGVAIVRSILALGAELGHVVVAEGIETQAQQEALQALGCLIGQGYLYGRPTPADQVPLRSAAHTRLASTGT